RVYRNNPVVGSGYFLRVLDDGTMQAGGSARSASLIGYSSMSDADTGEDAFPSSGMFSNGCVWPKSNQANSAARAWWMIGNETCFYLVVDVLGSDVGLAADGPPFFAGDLISLVPSDLHCFAISHCTASN